MAYLLWKWRLVLSQLGFVMQSITPTLALPLDGGELEWGWTLEGMQLELS